MTHLHIHFPGLDLLTPIDKKLDLIIAKGNAMSAELDALRQQVADSETVNASAVALLQGLKARLDAAIGSQDPAALTALSAELGASTQTLADAVTANTPTDKPAGTPAPTA